MQEELTPREQEIYDLLLNGSTPKEIAYSLNITHSTVVTHQKSMYRKLGVHNLNEFYVKCRPAGITTNAENGEYFNASFKLWLPSYGVESETNVAISDEEINGKIHTCVTVKGKRGDKDGSFALAVGTPNTATLNRLRTMKSFSFNALGDGKLYFVKPALSENNGFHYTGSFQTVKNKIITVTINIPDDLVYQHWSGNGAEFDQNKIVSLDIGAYNAGRFNLKFWDIRLFQ